MFCPRCGALSVLEQYAPPALAAPLVDEPLPRSRSLIAQRTVRQIVVEVAERRGLKPAELYTTAREYRISHARQEVFWEAHNAYLAGSRRLSLNMIGRHFPSPSPDRPHLDHTTVRHGIRRHADRLRAATMARVRHENEASAVLHGGR